MKTISGRSLLLSILGFLVLPVACVSGQSSSVLLYSLSAPETNVQAGVQQGSSVAVEGNFAVVGAPLDKTRGFNSGLAHVYDTATGARLHTLTNPTPASNDLFGAAVGLAGGWLAVGAPGDDTPGLRAGIVYVYDLAGATPAVPWLVLTNPSPVYGSRFGAAVALWGSRLVVGAPGSTVWGTNSAKVWFFDLAGDAPTVPVSVAASPEPLTKDDFGAAVALYDRRVMVGAPSGSGGPGPGGRAYLYNFSAVTPAFLSLTLTNPNAHSSANFGAAVAVQGFRLIVSATHDSAEFYNAGKVFVYDLANIPATVPWRTLTKYQAAPEDLFGSALVVSGSRLFVGARGDGSVVPRAGSVSMFDLDDPPPGGIAPPFYNPTSAVDDAFGCALAVSGDHMLVGACGDWAAAPASGSAYLYDLVGGIPSAPLRTLSTASLASENEFGRAVALSGARLVVTAPQTRATLESPGVAYVYAVTGPPPAAPSLTITNPAPATNGLYGSAAVLDGGRLFIAAPFDRPTALQVGRVYYHDLAGPAPQSASAVFTNPTPYAGSGFGVAVAVSGDRLVIGSPEVQVFPMVRSRVHVYDLTAAPSADPQFTLLSPYASPDYAFGKSVAISGARLVVGAPSKINDGFGAGFAFVFDLAGATPATPVLTVTNPLSISRMGFSHAIALEGTRLVVSMPFDGGDHGQGGIVYVYDLAGPTPTVPLWIITNPSGRNGEEFGYSLSLSGTRLAVGARRASVQGVAGGATYVFDFASATPTKPIATLSKPSPAAGDNFGAAVALEGGNVLVGAHLDDAVTYNRGAAYFYALGPTLRFEQSAPGLSALSWTPINSPGFVLQYKDTLDAANWLNAPSGATNPVAIPTTNATRFYRVAQP